jgi:hypothetical protein
MPTGGLFSFGMEILNLNVVPVAHYRLKITTLFLR